MTPLLKFDAPALHLDPDILALRREVETRYPSLARGKPFVVPRGDTEFWNYYRAHKAALRKARVFVYKSADNWILDAKPLDDPEAKKKNELAEVLERWQPRLESYPNATEIEESVMRNGVSQYLLCEDGETFLSAIPHILVDYLLKECGYDLVSRAEVLDRRGTQP